jgi:7-cyano-7-deazaguanine synthase
MLIERNNSITVLLSGGVDSTALIKYYQLLGFYVKGLHFYYGQPSAQSELNAVREISQYFNIDTAIIKLENKFVMRKDEYVCRNAIFVLSAAGYVENVSGIALGIHTGVSYYDCSESFCNDCQHILDGYFSGQLKLCTPFVHFKKQDIFAFCKEHSIPIEMTYSCEYAERPCGKCPSCLDRRLYNES